MMNPINQFYQQQHSPLLPRRSTEPVTLAPTASMIDPNLENHRIQQHTQLSPSYARLQMQHNTAAIHGQNNGYPAHIHNSNTNNNIVPAERSLPSTGVNDTSIEGAYAQFILFCNPSIPMDVDTTELRKVFQTPPKSDGKSFSPYRLFDLIRRLEVQEIKTWNQLVIELGVEKPDAAKNQSSQKVQQYAVRLKVNTSFSSTTLLFASHRSLSRGSIHMSLHKDLLLTRSLFINPSLISIHALRDLRASILRNLTPFLCTSILPVTLSRSSIFSNRFNDLLHLRRRTRLSLSDTSALH